MDLFGYKGADFSPCRKYRYTLWRIWDASKPMIMFIGLNPSTANEYDPDPTITRVIGFATRWGYGGVYMMNLFSLVSSKPKDLLTCADPVNGNDKWLIDISKKSERIVFAWGSFKQAKERSKFVSDMFPEAYALDVNDDGAPQHPLYVKGDIVPVLFKKSTSEL
jgi:hypothetical protein